MEKGRVANTSENERKTANFSENGNGWAKSYEKTRNKLEAYINGLFLFFEGKKSMQLTMCKGEIYENKRYRARKKDLL